MRIFKWLVIIGLTSIVLGGIFAYASAQNKEANSYDLGSPTSFPVDI